jgi:hypothetical protein
MYGMTRGTTTLIGAAGAGLLIWFATQPDSETNPGFWASVGLVAAAGLVLAFSQLVGGWTKWGMPQVSTTVLGLGFLPALVAGGWVLLAHQPESNWFADKTQDWAADIGLGGIVDDLGTMLPAIAFALGLLLGFVFDTTGPRAREAERYDELTAEEEWLAEEPIAAEREKAVDDDYRQPDPRLVDAIGPNERRVEIREDGAPVVPQHDGERDREA